MGRRACVSVFCAACWRGVCAPASFAQEKSAAPAAAGEATVQVIQTAAAAARPEGRGDQAGAGDARSADAGARARRSIGRTASRPGHPSLQARPEHPHPTSPVRRARRRPESGTVKRPEKPATPPNPEELHVRPDKDGVVRFQFRGQSWPDVLEWFGDISGMSVDWQELPADYLNIATQRGYTVDEIRDLLNRHLLARGYTMLQQDEFLIVVKCEQLSAGLVPQVSAGRAGRTQSARVRAGAVRTRLDPGG